MYMQYFVWLQNCPLRLSYDDYNDDARTRAIYNKYFILL